MKKRLIALLLCLVMLVTCMGVGVFMPPDIKLLSESGEAVASVSVPQSDRVQLATDYKSSGEPGYQWQLSTDGKTWINIYGQTGESVQLSYAMVCNMLNDEGTAQVRCMVTDGESEYASRAAEVSVDYSAPARPAQAAKAPVSVAPVSNPAPASEGETQGTKTIIINYVFQNGEQAANPWTATLPENDTMTRDVESPVVIGYKPNLEVVHVNSSAQITYEVVYSPTFVNFTVKHYLQNISNDEYILDTTETIDTKKTEDPVGDGLQKTYEGFTALLYDTTTKIAADGSTVVEIYYDRNYYLLNLDLDGGYGAEPMYARYGTKVEIADPTKAGYTFDGWTPTLPETILAKNMTCKAGWTENNKAKVTVVIWGQNANDNDYSLITSYDIEAKPGEKLKLNESTAPIAGGTLESFGLASDKKSVNPDSDSSPYGDKDAAKHFEGRCTGCHNSSGTLTNLKSGSVCLYNDNGRGNLNSGTNYCFLYLNGKYYEITKDQYDSWKTSNGASIRHGNDTYAVYEAKSDLWEFAVSDEITVAADGTSILNVYYDRKEFTLTFKYDYGGGFLGIGKDYRKTETVTARWGADIGQNFLSISKNANGSLWSRTTDGDEPWTSYLQIMPSENRTYYCKNTSSTAQPAQYWVENQTAGQFSLQYTVNAYHGNTLYISEEDIYDIVGFTFSYGITSGNNRFTREDVRNSTSFKWKDAKFYYTRNSYTLSFYNHTEELTDKQISVKYEANLNEKTFIPAYPDGLEPGAYRFEGWYTDQFFHNKVTETDKMPAADLMLYAHWVPKTHTVEFYLNGDAMEAGNKLASHPDVTVTHGQKIAEPDDPKNGEYIFVGWFYMDGGTEKAISFKDMPINKDLKVYAKWSSNKLVEYTIKYQLEDGTEIAPPSNGSALAGTTKTFEAKSGDKLNEGYKTGYYPQTSSHSITFNIEGGNEYAFVYVAKQKVEYTVKYLEKGTGNQLADPQTVTTSAAIVTETFKPVTGYAPDAYQKKLVLAAENNEIIFWYTKDEVHAPVQVIHWIQSVSGNGYTEYQSSTNLNGVIGNPYSEAPLTIKGFQYNNAKSSASGTLTAEGLVLNLYYDRIVYPYEFRFLEQGTNKKLDEPITGSDRYEALVSEAAKEIAGYTLVSAATQSMTIGVEAPENVAQNNVKTFYYKEKSVDIKYEVVGPAGCGTLTNYAETVKVLTGEAQGSTAAVSNDTYKFVGWYSDEGCTVPVNTSWVDAENKLTPGKTETYGSVQGYKSATYYAKFDYNVVDLTITKAISGKDSQQLYGERSFVFHVKGTDENTERIDIDVVVKIKNGETSGSVVLKALPIGSYTITEDTGWSWRYECNGVGFTGATGSNTGATARCTLVGGVSNAVTFTNSWLHAQWLSFTTSVRNIFGTQNNK